MISSALRTLRILELVGRTETPIGVTEISRNLGIVPGTVFRGLDALEVSGFIERYQSSSRYTLGPVVSQLRQSLLARFHLKDFAIPFLRQLAFATGETVSLTVPVGWFGLRLAAAPGTNDVTHSHAVGEIYRLDQTVAGRAVLAYLPADKQTAYFAWCKPNLSKAEIAGLREELDATRQRGFAFETLSYAPDTAAAAFALTAGANPVAGITIEGPVLHLKQPSYHDQLKQCMEIVQSLEKLVQARRVDFEGPFAHLDPSSINLAAKQ